MDHGRPEVLQGTLDLMILKTLESLGPLHGFGVARRLEQVSDGILRLNEGTVYTALLRLGHRGWIRSSWGISDRNRKARFYAITPAGRRQLTREEQGWRQMTAIIARVLRLAPEE
jgi:PadR family transcriptional regulator PadR